MSDWQAQVLGDVLARNALNFAGQEALVISGQRLTYLELHEKAVRMADGLRAVGVGHGDHVAICMGNSLDWVICFYAAAMIGAVTVPINTRFKADEMQYCLKQADVKALLLADKFLKIDYVDMLRSICPALDRQLPDPGLPMLAKVVVFGTDVPAGAMSSSQLLEMAAAYSDASSRPVVPDDVLLMQFTSGTTSYPKGVMLTHDNMLRNAAYVAERFDLRTGDRYYSARPFFHVAGTTLSLLAALTSGACLFSSPHFDPDDGLRVMSGEQCTHTSGNDTMFLMLLNHPDFAKYPMCLRGGWASANPEVSRQVVERMGMRKICQAYGLSEASPNVAMSRHDDDLEKRINGWAHVLKGVEVRIVDPETRRDQPPGASGEILVRGASVMKGYYKMPEQTAQAMDSDGWLHTGDVGVMDGDGRMRFISRIKDVFRVGGENVAPGEVEDVLLKHPAISQAQVVGVPDARLIEVPAAYVILKDGESVAPADIMAWSKERMAGFRVPRYVRIVDTFEQIGMTGSVKVQKNKLRAQAIIDFKLQETATKSG